MAGRWLCGRAEATSLRGVDVRAKRGGVESVAAHPPGASPRGSCVAVFGVFLRLGCTAFGGPVAHLAHFREEFVRRRRWLGEAEYADLVALCQFLPGPASSQVGFALGLRRAGVPGAFAAWLGFTLPSAVLMLAFAFGLTALGSAEGAGWVAGLKLAAVAVVANAVWGMAATLCPDRARALLALGAAAVLLVVAHPFAQVGVLALGGLAGLALLRNAGGGVAVPESGVRGRAGWPWLAAFALLLAGLPLAAAVHPAGWVQVTDAFYRAGSLVFGGGHVVLPLLEERVVAPGWVDRDTFLAGYGAAQAVPGPLFAFSAFLGASADVGPGGVAGGVLALVAVYVPAWLLVLGVLPVWDRLRAQGAVRAALAGTNAAVVGVLLAALYDPVWTSAVDGPRAFAVALVAFALLRFAAVPPWALVAGCAAAGALL